MPSFSHQNFARAIRDLRKKHGLSQSQLANIAGVSLPSVSRIEGGKETARLDVLVKILDALGYDLVLREKHQSKGDVS